VSQITNTFFILFLLCASSNLFSFKPHGGFYARALAQ
jgi:hypothetical protein